jgi:ubiquinone/menaquinone biosynthesis C-methylase UbiE
MVETSKKLDFWNSRAELGEIAGTNDFPLKDLELKLIHQRITRDSSVLDVGCGNGDTLLSLVRENSCSGVGVDFSDKMVALGQSKCRDSGYQDRVRFQVGAVPGLPEGLGEFDYALTERCLINLDSESTQQQAFLEIMSHVKRGGYFLMIESSVQGLERTNELRQMLDLEKIDPPWHNVFLDETSVPNWATCEFSLEEVIPFSSTYHFLSRVVYARLAADKGEPLRYDSDINMLACRLPIVGNFGPARLWLWHRK